MPKPGIVNLKGQRDMYEDSHLESQYEDRYGTDLYDSDDEPFFDESDEDDDFDEDDDSDESEDFTPETTTRNDWDMEDNSDRSDFPHLVYAGTTSSAHYPH